MKIEVKVSGLTQLDLVNLFSCSTEGSSWLSLYARRKDYVGTPLESPDDCREDKWAKVLLAGGSIFAFDMSAEDEDEFYGNLHHKFDEKQGMRYTLTLADIEAGISRAMSSGTYIMDYVHHLMDEDPAFDLNEADALMQWIIFGEDIYG